MIRVNVVVIAMVIKMVIVIVIPVGFAQTAAVEDPAHHLAVLTGKDAVRQAVAKLQKCPKILQK